MKCLLCGKEFDQLINGKVCEQCKKDYNFSIEQLEDQVPMAYDDHIDRSVSTWNTIARVMSIIFSVLVFFSGFITAIFLFKKNMNEIGFAVIFLSLIMSLFICSFCMVFLNMADEISRRN